MIETSTASDSEWDNQIEASFNIYSNGVVSSTDFENFASVSNANKINTSVQIIGQYSGASLVIPVVITKRSSV